MITLLLRYMLPLLLAALPAAAGAQSTGADSPHWDVSERSIPELQERMTAGLVTSRQLTEMYLARIAAYDRQGPRLNAVVSLNPKALEQAEALDRERAARKVRGPLHGIPVLVKDNYETVEMATAAGSIALGSFRTNTDAYQVARLREAGAVIVGKTNMHELASGITNVSSVAGQTRNPYDLTRNPGGSSGGTGSAIAASFAAAGMGSDTCGSIRIPAANNSLVGLRGTRGLASSRGIVPLSHTQDIGGPIARTLEDLAIMLDATVGPDADDPATARSEGRIPRSFRDALRPGVLKGKRIGILTSLFGPEPRDPEVGPIVRKRLDEMKARGAEVVEVTVPGLDDLLRDSGVIVHEFKFDLMDYLARQPEAPVRSLDEIMKLGLYDSSMERNLTARNAVERRDTDAYRRALVKREALRHAVVATLEEHQLAALVYPTLQRKPVLIGDPQPGSNCSLSANSGLPALSVPAGFTDDGLPVGLELLGREWSEADLLALAFDARSDALRRAPFSAPPLVNGRAPAPVAVSVQASKEASTPAVAFNGTYDVTTGLLTYELKLAQVAAEDVRRVALHRGSGDGPGPIVALLGEPGAPTARGTVSLGHQAREALLQGRLYLQAHTRTFQLGTPPLRLIVSPLKPVSRTSHQGNSAR